MTPIVERSTVHVSDDTGRIAMRELRNTDYENDGSEAILTRYIYSNHLQSSSLELDEEAKVISYEEYHPYGTTAYQASNSAINAVAKRYRYTGKERDEESGLYYHGARYYIPWLGRWCSSDPLESKYAGMSPYNYSFNNPVMFNDPSGEDPKDGDNKKTTSNSLNASRYSMPSINTTGQIDNAKDVRSIPFRVGLINNVVQTGPLKGRTPAPRYSSDVEPILKADIYGTGHIGPKKDVEAILATIKQEYVNAVFENIRGGPFGAAGYHISGEKGSFKGAVVDQVSFGLHFSPTVALSPEPVNFGAKVEMKLAPAFEIKGYSFRAETTTEANGNLFIEHSLVKGKSVYSTGQSEIANGTLTNNFQVPGELRRLGVSKAMYGYLNNKGYDRVESSYDMSSDNFKAFDKVYVPNKLNLMEAVKAMPAAKALGKGFYPAVILPRYYNEKIVGLNVLWKRTPVINGK